MGSLWAFLLLFVLKSNECSDNDYFTSPAAIHKLVKVEQHFLAAFTEYASILEKRMEKVKNYLEDYEQSIVAGMTKPGTSNMSKLKVYDNQAELIQLSIQVSSHPLMTYRLIRRFVLQLQDLERDLGNQDEKRLLNVMEKMRKGIRLPQTSDVQGSIEGLLRVQDAYDLNITQFTQGNFQGLETNSALTANDCYQVGMYALEAQIYTRSIEWLQRAYLLTTQENDKSVSTERIVEALADAVAQHDKTQRREPKNIYVYRQPLLNAQHLLSGGKDEIELEKVSAQRQYVLYKEQENIMDLYNFAALCSGKPLQPPGHSRSLKCFYQSAGGIPISAEKVEYLHVNPDVYQVHEVLSERAMDRIIQLATPSMIRSKVQGTTAEELHSTTRTSTSAWIQESAHPDLKFLPTRVGRITGLNVQRHSGAEDLQISSYGIGGHYNPHLDVLFDDYPPGTDEKEKGDRIATFLIYLSEVGRGGGTAFPRLGIIAQPVKGSAIFWYNLRSDGKTDPLSLHGGCPVLYGTKHVANKWIRANAQFQTRKCELKKTDEEVIMMG